MYPDATPLLVGIAILLASLVSLRLGLSVAIIELILGALFGNLGVIHVESWMSYLAAFGGILLTFLAGTEIDTDLMREKFTESFLISFLSFLVPFIRVFLFAYFGAQWGIERVGRPIFDAPASLRQTVGGLRADSINQKLRTKGYS